MIWKGTWFHIAKCRCFFPLQILQCLTIQGLTSSGGASSVGSNGGNSSGVSRALVKDRLITSKIFIGVFSSNFCHKCSDLVGFLRLKTFNMQFEELPCISHVKYCMHFLCKILNKSATLHSFTKWRAIWWWSKYIFLPDMFSYIPHRLSYKSDFSCEKANLSWPTNACGFFC